MTSFLRNRIAATPAQNDFSGVKWENMPITMANASQFLGMNASFRYGIATESDSGLPEEKFVLIPLITNDCSRETLDRYYSQNVTMVHRFRLIEKNLIVEPEDAETARTYKHVYAQALRAKMNAEITEIDINDTTSLNVDCGMSEEEISKLTLVCAYLNYRQFRADYPTMPEQSVIAGAHAVAMAYRNGLVESHAAREFIFVGVKIEENGDVTITGFDPKYETRTNKPFKPKDVINNANLRLNNQLMELGLGIVIGAGATHYTMNHTTGGRRMNGQNVRALAINGLYKINPKAEDVSEDTQTSFFYNCLHPINKRAVASLVIHRSKAYSWYKNNHIPCPSVMYGDAFMNYRSKLTPAGCHKIYVSILALKAIAESGLAIFMPDLDLGKKLIGIYDDMLKAGARGHIGSMYYTDEPGCISQGEADDFLPTAAYFIQKKMASSSLASSPHLSSEMAAAAPDGWKRLVDQTIKVGASNAKEDDIKAYLGKIGQTGVTIDITNDKGRTDASIENDRQLKEIQALLFAYGEAAVDPAGDPFTRPEDARRARAPSPTRGRTEVPIIQTQAQIDEDRLRAEAIALAQRREAQADERALAQGYRKVILAPSETSIGVAVVNYVKEGEEPKLIGDFVDQV